MKKLFKTPALIVIFFSFANYALCANTYDWNGTSSLNGTSWNVNTNWKLSNGTVPSSAPSSATDIIRIGTNITSFTKQPTITANVSCASITFGALSSTTLTVNSGVTLKVTDLYFNHGSSSTANTTYQTTLAGAGTINCTNIQVGNSTYPPSALNGYVYTYVSSQVNQLTITGNVTMISNADGTNGNNYPKFQIDNNTVSLYGQIITQNNGALTTLLPSDPFRGRFNAGNPTTGNTNTVNFYIYNAQLIATPVAASQGVDFYLNGGSGAVNTIYAAASGTQAVYSSDTYVGSVPSTYYNLTFQGNSTKTALAGTGFSVESVLVTSGGAVDLNTNDPSVTIGTSSNNGSWTNSASVTQGSGSITLTGDLTNSGAISMGSAAFSISGNYVSSGNVTMGGGALSIGGNYTNSGTFTPGTGMAYFSGSTQALADNSANHTTFNNVEFSGSGTKTMSGSGGFNVSGSGVLTMSGSATLAAAGRLTLNSNASGSASIAEIPSPCSITGNVNVQRYMSAFRGYRLMSSPVYSSTVGLNKVYSVNYLLNSTYLTGTTGTAGLFDKAGNPTLYLYREDKTYNNTSFTGGNYRGINNLSVAPSYSMDGDGAGFNIPVSNGYLFYYRGSRKQATMANLTKAGATPTTDTLTATGTLNQGQVVFRDWYNPGSSKLGYSNANAAALGFNLAGNPYASSIDWESYNTSTSTSGIYVKYVSNIVYELNPVTKNYDTYQVGGAYTNKGSRTIASGQGFFVLATNSAAQMNINESAKTTTQNTGSGLFMAVHAVKPVNNSYIRLAIAADSINSDDMMIRFNNQANTGYVMNEDAPYMQGMGTVSLSSVSADNVKLAINAMPFPAKSSATALVVNTTTSGTYTLNLKDINQVPALYDIWLVDQHTRTSTNLRKNSSYTFTVDKTDTTTYGSKRFALLIQQNPALAYQLVSFNANKTNNGVKVEWKTSNEQNYTGFAVERSNDGGKTFAAIDSISSNGQGSYNFLDQHQLSGQNQYRLKQRDINDSISYSKVVTIQYSNQSNNLVKSNISVYPNPAVSSISVTVVNTTSEAANYNIQLSNSFGLVIKQTTSAQPTYQTDISNLMPGTYIVKVFNKKDNSLVGNSKFVKM